MRLFPILLAIIMTGCTSREIYEGAQAGRRLDCQKYTEPDRTRCIESTPARWEEYERARRGMPR